jgi:transcriptional regulator with XRE-family HTH domain
MPRTIAGLKIRERRRVLGLRQNELARRVGISPSYLHLIERNQRSIGGTLLVALGRELSLSVDELDGSAERRLRDGLAALAEDPAIGSSRMRAADTDGFIARFGAWAEGAARAHAAFRAAQAELETQADRMAHDQILAERVHAMLTEIAALRSIVEILRDGGDLSPQQRLRFESIVDEQSGRLAGTGKALAAHFDRITETRPREAEEEAEEFVFRAEAGAAIEAAAARLRAAAVPEGADAEPALRAALASPPAVAADWGRNRRLEALALALAEEAAPLEIAACVETCPEPARGRALTILTLQLADALRLPAASFVALGNRLGWEVEALVRAADGDVALVFRRFADLHHAGAPRAALLTADASGATLARAGALDVLPRKRRLDCPAWPIFAAGAGGVTRTAVDVSGEGRRLVLARARPGGMVADMLVLAQDRPGAGPGLAGLAVGNGCRTCLHAACPQRREPSVMEEA